jgi:hypothetical protein
MGNGTRRIGEAGMTDMEKVMAGLTMLADRKNDNTCEGLKCCKIAEDSLAILKDQESVIDALKSDLDETLAVLSEQPEIVRCRDCKRKGTLSCPKSPVRPDDWFCADGERR